MGLKKSLIGKKFSPEAFERIRPWRGTVPSFIWTAPCSLCHFIGSDIREVHPVTDKLPLVKGNPCPNSHDKSPKFFLKNFKSWNLQKFDNPTLNHSPN